MSEPVRQPADHSKCIGVSKIKDDHFIVGHLVYLKCLDSEGQEYWALRKSGLNDMEVLGMAHDMLATLEYELVHRAAPREGTE